jgi:hypothetical protein
MIWWGKCQGTIEGFPEYDEEKMPIEYYINEQEYYNEKTRGKNVPIPSDPKLIELNKSIFTLGAIHFDLEENKKYRVDIKYKSGYTNIEDNRVIDIESNLFSFEFIHEVFIPYLKSFIQLNIIIIISYI